MKIILCILIVWNLIVFALYGIDKWKSIHNKWRIKEATLIWVAFLMGAVGAILGMGVWHHKTKHIKFKILIPLAIIINAVVGFVSVHGYIDAYAKPYMITAETAPECDAIMVLGAFVYSDGNPSPVLTDRLDYALALYQSGKAEKILVSGDHGTKEYDEVNTMKDYLMAHGIPRANIFLDHAGFDTYDSMIRARDIFEIKKLLVSTQNFHIRRALYIARNLGIEAYGYPSEDKEWYGMKMLNLRESLAKIKAIIDVDILRREPKIGGEPIPIWKDGRLTDG